MITEKDLTDAFNNAGLDDTAKLAAFLKPAAVNAAVADIDGQITKFRNETSSLEVERQATLAELQKKREEILSQLSQK